MNEQQTVSLADAKRVIAAAETQATEIGQPMNIAVVDAGGNLVAHVRMDGAWLGSVDIAINKAYTPAPSTWPPPTSPNRHNPASSSTVSPPRTTTAS
jgi:uncharacterized protein GlcG (DUF336 family)